MNDQNKENEKVIKYITEKLKDGEIMLLIENVNTINRSNIHTAKLVITSCSLYFLQGLSIKKYFKALSIECVIVTPFSNQIAIFYQGKEGESDYESIIISSKSNVRIIQHIITVREKFCDNKEKLMVIVSSHSNLDSLVHAGDQSKSKVFGFLFKKKEDKKHLQERLSGEGDALHVNLSNFALEIGQKMYDQKEKNVKLLYINSTETFRFEEEKYTIEKIGSNKKIFIQQAENPQKQANQLLNPIAKDKNILMRKINKVNEQNNAKITQHLISYRNEEYKEELLYALEKQEHYEIFTTQNELENNGQQFIIDHDFLSEKDLRSIFFKLVQMIENSSQIFCSLSPENIIIGNEGIRISEIFSLLSYRIEIDYLSPEEFVKEKFSKSEIELINLWKAGILIFELAYGNIPFPAEEIVNCLMENCELELIFPKYSLRTQEFQSFIKSVLIMDPKKRGKSEESQESNEKWRDSIMKLNWLRYK